MIVWFSSVSCRKPSRIFSSVLLIADHFCMDVDSILKRNFYMVENEKIVTGSFRVTKEEQSLIELYRQASEDDRAAILCILNKYRKNPSASGDKAM